MVTDPAPTDGTRTINWGMDSEARDR